MNLATGIMIFVNFWLGYFSGWLDREKLAEARRRAHLSYGRLYSLYSAVLDMPREHWTARLRLAMEQAEGEIVE